jgi:hypothetical protein
VFDFASHVQETRQHIKLQKGEENLLNFFIFFPPFPLIKITTHHLSFHLSPTHKQNKQFK